ncbi:MAG TPA: TerC family protein [Myxococcota bacterium]|nr:TerC family protein [Myxococcota bacterium]
MEALLTTENAVALATLVGLEIVLGIDNIVFIAILTQRLPAAQQARARRVGLLAAMGMRIGLLLAIGWVMGLTAVLFEVFDHPVSGRDGILLLGGLFLVGKATWEIHDKLEGEEAEEGAGAAAASFAGVILQIVLLDVVFSLDSVITAVGMARELSIMVTAVVVSVLVMLVFAGHISAFIEQHPTLKILALSFLILIGVVLLLEGFGKHVEKGYVYFAMAFSLSVELVNLAVRRKRHPLRLNRTFVVRDDWVVSDWPPGVTPAPATTATSSAPRGVGGERGDG